MNAIQVRDLVKRYPGGCVDALAGVSFDVPVGQLFCLLGPNGAGKSTAVAILTTTARPTSGAARVAGWDVVGQQQHARRALGVVFQQPTVDANLTVEENLRLHAMLYGRYPWRPTYRLMPAGYRRQVGELADVLGLTGRLQQRVGGLSGGTRRKLEIVRALLHRPSVLVLDEPTTGLDPHARRSLWEYLQHVRARDETTILLTTHYLPEAEIADAVCVLSGGRILARGSPAELSDRHHNADQLLLDAADRAALRAELAAKGLRFTSASSGGAIQVTLGRRSPQTLLAGLRTALTRIELKSPSLEDSYLRLLDVAPTEHGTKYGSATETAGTAGRLRTGR